jgi:hypothetical protein
LKTTVDDDEVLTQMQLERDFEEYTWVKSRSGFGPNGETTDEVWDGLVAEKKEVEKWRYARFLYYDKMQEYHDLFGSSRPTLKFLEDTAESSCESEVDDTKPVVGRKRGLDDARERHQERSKRRKKVAEDHLDLDREMLNVVKGLVCGGQQQQHDRHHPPLRRSHSMYYSQALAVVQEMISRGELEEESIGFLMMELRDENTAAELLVVPIALRRHFVRALLH